ncbi:MAG: DNA-binding response regulator [Actinobacteria bacterium]|nr:DNA-binding response regulator [Actinomycetota bacterium]
MATTNILIVDDEEGVRELLCDALRIAGYSPLAAANGRTALALLREKSVALVIADVNMPQMNGFDMLSKMRAQGLSTPVLLLSARGERPDITEGLRLGADDYVGKPFGLEEIMLRVKAILRRTQQEEAEVIITCGPIAMNDDTHEVHMSGELVDLSPTEFRLLKYLMQNAGKVVSKKTLLATVWGMEFASSTAVVDTYVSYLRRKLHRDGFEGLRTVRGVGYQLVAGE